MTTTSTDASGNVVQTINLGPHAAGTIAIPWNGQDTAGGTVPVGTYTVTVNAADASGQAINVSQNVTGVVQNISFSQGYPEADPHLRRAGADLATRQRRHLRPLHP